MLAIPTHKWIVCLQLTAKYTSHKNPERYEISQFSENTLQMLETEFLVHAKAIGRDSG